MGQMRIKRLTAILLAGITLLALFCLPGPYGLMEEAEAAKASSVGERTVRARIQKLRDAFEGLYFTTTQEHCGCAGSSCSKCNAGNVIQQNWVKNRLDLLPNAGSYTMTHYYYRTALTKGGTCAGFANFAGWYLFAKAPSDQVTFQQIATGPYDRTTMAKAQVGDIIRLGSTPSGAGHHSAVVLAVKSSGVQVLDDNWTARKVTVHDIDYGKYDRYAYVTISRATNYGEDTGRLTLAGLLDGKTADNLKGYGTVDVYVDGKRVADNVTKYSADLPFGTSYEIRGIQTKNQRQYDGVSQGSLSGTVDRETVTVTLRFSTPAKPTYVQVSFNGNGGKSSASRKKVISGSALGELPTATKKGGSFSGWYTEKTGGTQITDRTTVSQNMTVYAHYTSEEYELKVKGLLDRKSASDLRGWATFSVYLDGKLAASNVSSYSAKVAYGTKYKITGVKATGARKYAGLAQGKLSGRIEGNADVVLKVNTKACKVTFNGAGGKSSERKREYSGGQRLGTLPTATRTGCRFDGWYTAKKGGQQVTAQTQVDGDMKLYAHWTKVKTHTVRFYGNGGRCGEGKRILEAGARLSELPTPVRKGYRFDGWYTEKTGGTKIKAGASVTKDLKLYAHWTKG